MAEQYVHLALSKIGADTPTTQVLLRVGVDIAQAVSKAKNLKGAEKMVIVQQTLRNVLDVQAIKEKLSAEDIIQLNTVINDIIPLSITLVIEAGRGQYDFKKPSISCALGFFCKGLAATAVAVPVPAPSEPVATPTEVQPIVLDPVPSAEPEKK
jgi:hypothetical protein